MSDVAIRVEGLWKRYGLPIAPAMKQFAAKVRGKEFTDDGPWALSDISFEVNKGETLGIIGRNGAGKSTLLKALAGVTPPTRGSVQTFGSMFPMIELNAGMHPDLTGRENVRLLGAVMGLTRKKLESIIPAIEDFCELGEWMDRPVRMYSSGMYARLGFAVAVNIESDIILVDETFSVGDLNFQNKSLARVNEMRKSGATILLVSHSLDTLQFVAQKGIVIEKGKMIAQGASVDALREYESLVFKEEKQRFKGLKRHISSGEVEIEHARIFNEANEEFDEIPAGKPFGFEISFEMKRSLERPVFSMGILTTKGFDAILRFSEDDGFNFEPLNAGDKVTVRLWFNENHLVSGAYNCTFAIRDGSSFEVLERLAGVAAFAVTGHTRSRGVIATPAKWELKLA